MRSSLKQMLASALLSAAVGIAPTANALQYNFDYNGIDDLHEGAAVSFDLIIDVNTLDGVCPSGCPITAVTGTSPQYGNVAGLLAIGSFGNNDNLLYSPPNPYLSWRGFTFDLVSGVLVNIYESSGYWASGEAGAPPLIFDGVGTVSVSPVVPEPETYSMLLAGLGLLGLIARRRKLNP